MRERQHEIIWVYGVLMAVFFFSTIYAIILWWKSEFIMHRYIEDSKEEPDYSSIHEGEEPNGEVQGESFRGSEQSNERRQY